MTILTVSFAELWDHYFTDVARFVLEMLRQPHVIYAALILLLLTGLRGRCVDMLSAVPGWIKRLRDAGVTKAGPVEFSPNDPKAREHRIESAGPDAEVAKGATGWKTSVDDLSRKAIIQSANALLPGASKRLMIDVNASFGPKRMYFDGILEDYPNESSDAIFEVKMLHNDQVSWSEIVTKMNASFRSYSKATGKKVIGYLLVVVANDFTGDRTKVVTDLIFETSSEWLKFKLIEQQSLE